MKACVTGASGFLGRHLVKGLLQEGHEVRAFVRRPTEVPDQFRGRLEYVLGDICDARAVEQAVAGCDQVYHLAAIYRRAGLPDSAYRAVNVDGTRNVLEACSRHNVKRLIHCSTMGVHGHVSEIPSHEGSPFNPGDIYQQTKLEGERLVWEFCAERGVPFSVVRPAGIYGPGDLRFLKLFRSIQQGYFVMLGSGRTHYHLAYIDDLVNGFLRCGQSEQALNHAFLIGHDRPVTLNELVSTVAKALNVRSPRWRMPVWPVYATGALCEAVCTPFRISPPIFRRRVDFFTHDRAFNIQKAKSVLGYAPQVYLAEGIARTANWYRSKGLLGGGSAGGVAHATAAWLAAQPLLDLAQFMEYV